MSEADKLIRQARALQRRAAEIDPHRCPPECSEMHTFEWPCASAHQETARSESHE